MTVLVEKAAPGVRLLRLHRPEVLNALDDGLVADLAATFGDAGRDTDCAAIVLTGDGRGFCAGLDLSEIDIEVLRGGPEAVVPVQRRFSDLVRTVYRTPVPVLAAINGPVFGGGLAVAMAADIRLAVPEATLTAGFARLGLCGVELALGWLLPRVIGHAAALEFTASGATLTAEEAAAAGLVDHLVDAGDLLPRALELATRISARGRLVTTMTKQTLRLQREVTSLDVAMELEDRTQMLMIQRGAFAEAAARFRDRGARRSP